jgi:hypothetical protein
MCFFFFFLVQITHNDGLNINCLPLSIFWSLQFIMRKYRVLQLGLQWTFVTHGIYMVLNANRQVVAITVDTLCCI